MGSLIDLISSRLAKDTVNPHVWFRERTKLGNFGFRGYQKDLKIYFIQVLISNKAEMEVKDSHDSVIDTANLLRGSITVSKGDYKELGVVEYTSITTQQSHSESQFRKVSVIKGEWSLGEFGFVSEMAQVMVKSGKVTIARTAVVKVASLEVEQRIKHLEKTLIGRVWNPLFKNMDSLLRNMPKFWNLEGKVIGADLGNGRFHFSFQSKEELNEVLHNVPYHYDSWMVSLVRWEPSVAPDYPSHITFWARITGLPNQYGGADSLMAVGDLLGHASKVDVDVDAGFVRVTFNGFKPLTKVAIVPFDNGDEVEVQIDYEAKNGKKEEIIKSGEGLGTGSQDQGAWEFPRKKSVKRTLNQVDFGLMDNSGNQREEGRRGVLNSMGHGMAKVPGRDGRFHKRESHRNGTSYRAKEWRGHSHGIGRSRSWPVPLYKTQKEHNTSGPSQGHSSVEMRDPIPLAGDKGKGKEGDSMEFDGNVGTEDDDLLPEEGELGVDDFEFEDPGALIAGSSNHGDYGDQGGFEGETGNEGDYGAENYYQERDGGSPEATG